MDLEDFEGVLRRLGVDLWNLIETALSVAARDHGRELRVRRDGIVELLYAAPDAPRCRNCSPAGGAARPCLAEAGERGRIPDEREKVANEERNGGASPSMAQSPGGEQEEEEEEKEEKDDRGWGRYSRPVEDEQSRILAIKDLLDDPDQPEDSLVHMLQSLADMDITFKALKVTDIGRHVNGLRKHPSSEVRRLVKLLVRKWKDLVDEWVKSNSHENATPSIITDGDSPQQIQAKNSQSRNQVNSETRIQAPDFGCSPNTHSVHQTSDTNGTSGPEKAKKEGETRAKASPPGPPPRKEAPTKPSNPRPPSPAPPPARAEQQLQQQDDLLDPEKLASARRRLHENYQEAQNAKKQRTIQVMDIHDIPRPKNAFFRPDHRGVPGQAPVKRKGY